MSNADILEVDPGLEDECWWCDAYWQAWATFCPTHEGSGFMTDADKEAALNATQQLSEDLAATPNRILNLGEAMELVEGFSEGVRRREVALDDSTIVDLQDILES